MLGSIIMLPFPLSSTPKPADLIPSHVAHDTTEGGVQ